jgi:uncharacterized membrane protein YoaK (UPF0700 family)
MAAPKPKTRHLRRVSHLAAHRRSSGSDTVLATILAAIAGCANAGGFIAFGQYASHMTGYLSQLADSPALQNLHLAGQSIMAISLFIAGAASCAFMVNWARQRRPHHQYALPIAFQGVLFLVFAGLGGLGQRGAAANMAALGLLFFIMGLQNATITKISEARIRTTHATGMITDVGIEVGRAVFGHVTQHATIGADKVKLRILLQLLCSFLLGGIVGAFGYGAFGFLFSLPLGLVLLMIAVPRLL